MASNLKLGSNWKACGYLYDMRRWSHGNSRVTTSHLKTHIMICLCKLKFSFSLRLTLGSVRAMTTMEVSRGRRSTTSSRVLARPTTWFSIGCRCKASLWSQIIFLLVGHWKPEVATPREAKEWGEKQSSDARGERESRRRSAGEEPEVEAEEAGTSLLFSFCLFLL